MSIRYLRARSNCLGARRVWIYTYVVQPLKLDNFFFLNYIQLIIVAVVVVIIMPIALYSDKENYNVQTYDLLIAYDLSNYFNMKK